MKCSCERSHARAVDRRAETAPKSSWPQQLNSEQAARRVGDRTESKASVDGACRPRSSAVAMEHARGDEGDAEHVWYIRVYVDAGEGRG